MVRVASSLLALYRSWTVGMSATKTDESAVLCAVDCPRQLGIFAASAPPRRERGTVRTRNPVNAITSAIVHRFRSGQFCGCSGDSVHSFCKSTPRLLIASMAIMPSPGRAASSRLSRFGGGAVSAVVGWTGLSISAAGGVGCGVAISGVGEVEESTRPEWLPTKMHEHAHCQVKPLLCGPCRRIKVC